MSARALLKHSFGFVREFLLQLRTARIEIPVLIKTSDNGTRFFRDAFGKLLKSGKLEWKYFAGIMNVYILSLYTLSR